MIMISQTNNNNNHNNDNTNNSRLRRVAGDALRRAPAAQAQEALPHGLRELITHYHH